MIIMNLKIEKNIPIPTPSNSRPSGWGLVADEMQVGDSVFCNNNSDRGSLYNALTYRKAKVTCRKIDKGYRVWRIG